jgi:hypothetical protein
VTDFILDLPTFVLHTEDFWCGKDVVCEAWRGSEVGSTLRLLYTDIFYTIVSDSEERRADSEHWLIEIKEEFALCWAEDKVRFKIPATKKDRQKIRCRYHVHDSGEKCE